MLGGFSRVAQRQFDELDTEDIPEAERRREIGRRVPLARARAAPVHLGREHDVGAVLVDQRGRGFHVLAALDVPGDDLELVSQNSCFRGGCRTSTAFMHGQRLIQR